MRAFAPSACGTSVKENAFRSPSFKRCFKGKLQRNVKMYDVCTKRGWANEVTTTLPLVFVMLFPFVRADTCCRLDAFLKRCRVENVTLGCTTGKCVCAHGNGDRPRRIRTPTDVSVRAPKGVAAAGGNHGGREGGGPLITQRPWEEVEVDAPTAMTHFRLTSIISKPQALVC